ncbi:beta-ketoacyl synthase [Pseudidiomarina halophila]|uniref:Beta-ketoacyl synthase n=2 Tax=Pseudidiomarina halophila TaxID=1449799 RepID=A0A432XVL0_9GAMM|nr:beta-ketoacyl synthase [Pseudidiomarina halophila]
MLPPAACYIFEKKPSVVYDFGSFLTNSFADFKAEIMTSYVAASALHLSDSTSAPSAALKSIPASTRRRLSSYAKLLLAALFEVIEQHPGAAHAPVVLASRHGDLQRTIRLLNELVAGELLSPTQFCLSVNNAVLGQFSMLVDNQQGMTTVGAGAETLPSGWLEATLQLQEHPQVLVVYADEPPPHPYDQQCQSPAQGIAFAALLSKEPAQPLKLKLTRQLRFNSEEDDVIATAKQLHASIQGGGSEVQMRTGKHLWSWNFG